MFPCTGRDTVYGNSDWPHGCQKIHTLRQPPSKAGSCYDTSSEPIQSPSSIPSAGPTGVASLMHFFPRAFFLQPLNAVPVHILQATAVAERSAADWALYRQRAREHPPQRRHGPNAQHLAAHGALHSYRQGAPPAPCPSLRSRVAQHGRGTPGTETDEAAPGLASLRTSVRQPQGPKRICSNSG